jgi:hypothetical protein
VRATAGATMGKPIFGPNIFKGQIDLSVLIPVAVGILYAGTGNWSESRWTGALAIMGLGPATKMGYERGYWTENPEITRYIGPVRDEHGRFVSKKHGEQENDG